MSTHRLVRLAFLLGAALLATTPSRAHAQADSSRVARPDTAKARSLLIRGFNLDHGTDFQTRLEGMPINMPSHAHGQGYTDLNFLIPELVDYVDYRLGVYHTELGDFSSAGGAATRDRHLEATRRG